MLLAMLGMAVGTGNIWRFPRVAATNGGGSFLVAWAVFLLLWSVPLLILEFGMGKATRSGTIGSFVKTIGPGFAWMGAWVAFVATAIMFYYSVVMGWTIRFFLASVTGDVPSAVPEAFWEGYAGTPAALVTHIVAMCMGLFVVSKGVKGIETAAKFLIPSLIFLVIVLAIRAVTLPGAADGLAFLFTPHLAELADSSIWLEALTQNAWDTGAGWGLVLTYAIYMRSREDTALNAFVIGFGNNTMSLLAGIMVLCTVFAVMPDAADQIVGAGNEGLTFIWVPQLFALIPGGRFFMTLFFLALVFAAWTSLVAMIELASRILIDLGLTRGRAIAIVGTAGIAFGAPSALNWTDTPGAGPFFRQSGLGVGSGLDALRLLLRICRAQVRRDRMASEVHQYGALRHPRRGLVGLEYSPRDCGVGAAHGVVAVSGPGGLVPRNLDALLTLQHRHGLDSVRDRYRDFVAVQWLAGPETLKTANQGG